MSSHEGYGREALGFREMDSVLEPLALGPIGSRGYCCKVDNSSTRKRERVRVNTVYPYPCRWSTIARFLAEVRNAEAQNIHAISFPTTFSSFMWLIQGAVTNSSTWERAESTLRDSRE